MTPEEILGHTPRLLSQAQREFFFANGYLLVERAIDTARLSRLREAFAALQGKGGESDCPADFEFEALFDTGGGSWRVSRRARFTATHCASNCLRTGTRTGAFESTTCTSDPVTES